MNKWKIYYTKIAVSSQISPHTYQCLHIYWFYRYSHYHPLVPNQPLSPSVTLYHPLLPSTGLDRPPTYLFFFVWLSDDFWTVFFIFVVRGWRIRMLVWNVQEIQPLAQKMQVNRSVHFHEYYPSKSWPRVTISGDSAVPMFKLEKKYRRNKRIFIIYNQLKLVVVVDVTQTIDLLHVVFENEAVQRYCIMFMQILCLHISMYLCLIITIDCACSALLITIDNVNTICACVYLQSLAVIQQWPTRDIGKLK